jgi:myo-inositol-1(or 4)-monophosphatase
MKPEKEQFAAMKNLAFDAAIGAGKIVERNFYKGLDRSDVREKKRGDYVTNADIQTERYIISQIRKKFPNARILAEESGESSGLGQRAGGDYLWLIDPIDGTTNYSLGIPNFFVIISIAKRLRPGEDMEVMEVVFMAAYQPITRQLYWAEKGKGAFYGKRRIHVSSTSQIRDSKCAIHVWREYSDAGKFLRMREKATMDFKNTVKTGSICATCVAVASGRIEGIIGNLYNPHDHGALHLLVEEAGGIDADLNGKSIPLFAKNNTEYVVSNRALHGKLMAYAKRFIKGAQNKAQNKMNKIDKGRKKNKSHKKRR